VGVRVWLRIELSGRVVDAIALVNTGYEGDVPEVLVP